MGKTLAVASHTDKSPKPDLSPTPDSHNAPCRSDSTKPPAAASEPSSSSLAPPPRPAAQQNGNTPDYFSVQVGSGSLSLEPNPFDKSFGGVPETPGGTKLPSVASLTSPSSLLPGGGSTPFNWGGGSLRTGPLSPAMLSGPAGDYFADTHLRGGFPTPNESSLRTGLTPGGSGSMFPAPSPSSQALFSQLQNGGSGTPNTMDFHRTALAAAAAKREQQNAQSGPPHHAPPTSQPQAHSVTSVSGPSPAPVPKMDAKPLSGPFDPHDNDAANGLYLLAQGRNSAQQQAPYAAPPPPKQPPVMTTSVPSTIPPPAPMHPAQGPGPMRQPGRQQMRQQTSPVNGHTNGHTLPAMNGDSADKSGRYGASEASSPVSDKGETTQRLTTRNKKRNSTGDAAPATNGRRKAQESRNSPPNKKVKTNSTASSVEDGDGYSDEEEGKEDQPKQKMTEDEKRKNFLERNRVAALKCRQRKKQWLASLQSKVEVYTTENEALSSQIAQLREEIVHLKTLLLAHKDCPITQQQGMHGAFVQQSMEAYGNGQINPYGMAPQMQAQQGMPTQVDQRRYSEARMA